MLVHSWSRQRLERKADKAKAIIGRARRDTRSDSLSRGYTG